MCPYFSDHIIYDRNNLANVTLKKIIVNRVFWSRGRRVIRESCQEIDHFLMSSYVLGTVFSSFCSFTCLIRITILTVR